MNKYTFTIDGVGLRTNPNAIPSYPDEIAPYDHQIAMEDILTNDDDFTAINTAPTGGGKTYSWVIPANENDYHILAAFPTNALAEDQRESIDEYKEKFTDPDKNELDVLMLTGAAIRRQMQEEGTKLSKGDWIEREIRERQRKYDSLIVLTNPDIFTLLRRDMFTATYAKNQSGFFDAVVFDEFHIADTKGWNSLLFLIDEMYADTQRGSNYATTSKFIFLSATPEEKVYERLKEDMSIPTCHDLTETTENGREPWSQVSEKDNWRAVMPPVEIELRGGDTFNTADELLDEENYDEVLNFCSNGRTVAMLDGMKEVDDMYDALSQDLPQDTVERIDGFNGNNIESKLDRFDTLISNSAVEVGIDFDVDRILMSGYQQKSFLQRIGRLRNNEDRLKAVCYVPRQILDGFRARVENAYTLLPQDQPLPRKHFEEMVKNLFPSPRDPELFASMYSSIEAFMHIERKADNMTGADKKQYLIQARKRLANHFFDSDDRELTGDRLQNILKKSNNPTDAFSDALSTYRSSGLSTLAYDRTTDTVKTYSIFYFLRYGRVEFVTESEFASRVPNRHAQDVRQNSPYSLGYCIYHGRRDPHDEDDNGRLARIGATQAIRDLTEIDPAEREPVTQTGLEIRMDNPVPGLEHLNEELSQQEFLCYPLKGSSYRIQQEYNLDDFFFLYDLTDLRGSYSLALGLNALYLHCHVVNRCEKQNSSASSIPVHPDM